MSDGEASATATVTVVVAKKVTGGDQCINLWDATIAYPTSGTQVTWAGKIWENKWYANIGEDPITSGQWGVWKEVGTANCN
ncbi:hypothetical protein QNZ87_004798 [Vibrio parahaemolyticus]|nr:hypothetical protein [Vibrio parahaemolyticus]